MNTRTNLRTPTKHDRTDPVRLEVKELRTVAAARSGTAGGGNHSIWSWIKSKAFGVHIDYV